MKTTLTYLTIAIIFSACCTKVYFKSDETFWFDNYENGDELIFESNKGDLDTLRIINKIVSKPNGECNPMVSSYDHEFVRVDYEIKKDLFTTQTGWLIQHAAEPDDEVALPVLRFLNMEYNEIEGPLKESEIELPNKGIRKVFVFDESNCGMNYNQRFGLINFKWNKEFGLVSYENSDGEIWSIK